MKKLLLVLTWLLSSLTSLDLIGINIPMTSECGFKACMALAQEKGSVKTALRLNGYGTISYTVDDRDKLAPFRDISQKPQKPFSTDSTWRMDSRLGIQTDYRVNTQLEFVMQTLLRDRFEGTCADIIESAYAGYRPFAYMDLRAGRIGYDAFLMSDIRNTGYAYQWVRPPTEFYSWIPIFYLDGTDAAYTIEQDNVYWRIKAQAGKSSFALPMGSDNYQFKTEDLWSVTLSRQSGPAKIKMGYSQFSPVNEVSAFNLINSGLKSVAEATTGIFPDISEEAASLGRDIAFKNNKITYITLGASYDDGQWIAQGEIGRSTAEYDILPNGKMGYASLGYRLSDFIPYFTFSAIKPGSDLHEAESDWSSIGQEALHSQALYLVNSTRMKQKTNSLGVRWDFHNQAAFKFQWDNVHIDSYGYGLWRRSYELQEKRSTVNLYTFSMEFMF